MKALILQCLFTVKFIVERPLAWSVCSICSSGLRSKRRSDRRCSARRVAPETDPATEGELEHTRTHTHNVRCVTNEQTETHMTQQYKFNTRVSTQTIRYPHTPRRDARPRRVILYESEVFEPSSRAHASRQRATSAHEWRLRSFSMLGNQLSFVVPTLVADDASLDLRANSAEVVPLFCRRRVRAHNALDIWRSQRRRSHSSCGCRSLPKEREEIPALLQG